MFGQTKKPTLEDRKRQQLLDSDYRLRPTPWFEMPAEERERRSAYEQAFYELFSWFAVAIESSSTIEWTIDATNKTFVDGSDSPVFGRHFDVYFNAVRLGHIQATPAYFDRERFAHVSISLPRLHYLPYDRALVLVQQIIWFVGSQQDKAHATGAATAALSGYLWEVVRLSQIDDPEADLPVFEHRIAGPCVPLREHVAHWQRGEVPPEELVKWRHERRDAD